MASYMTSGTRNENVQWDPLDPKVRAYWTVKGIFPLSFLLFIISMIAASSGARTDACLLIAIVWVIGLLLVYLWALLFYNNFRFSIQWDGVYINRGIWFKSERSIPYERIQHIMITRGPIEKLFGISDIHLYTAGTASMAAPGGSRGIYGAEGFIPGLREPEPLRQEIWDRVIRSRSGSGLGDEVHDKPAEGSGDGGEPVLIGEVKAIRGILERIESGLER